MRRPWQQNQPMNLLFGLSNESVEFRNRWRGFAWISVWLALSGVTMIFTLLGVHERLHAAVLIGMSLIKYLPLMTIVYALARLKAAEYLDDIYELDDPQLASSFLEEVTFGYGREWITINEGRISPQDERSPMILIGGPGMIRVNLDSVALLEKVDGEPTVIHPRSEPWTLGRFERIREIGKNDEVGRREYAIINLRDQFVSGLSIRSRTKDGIPIEAQDIKVIFSILRRQGGQDDGAQGDAYLYDEAAVESLVYQQTLITPEPVTVSGIAFPWNTTVIPLVYAELEELIRTRTLSEILATIGQKEIDETSNNDQTIAQLRVEMTGRAPVSPRVEARAPHFESRSKISAQFYNAAFREKAAKLGVAVEWIDVGTWQLPSALILEKHKEAWSLARDNTRRRASIDRTKRTRELEEIAKLVQSVVIDNYESKSSPQLSEKEAQRIVFEPERRRDLMLDQVRKRDPVLIAVDILKAFRKEMVAAKTNIEGEAKSEFEKRAELANIDKALININYLVNHWIKG